MLDMFYNNLNLRTGIAEVRLFKLWFDKGDLLLGENLIVEIHHHRTTILTAGTFRKVNKNFGGKDLKLFYS